MAAEASEGILGSGTVSHLKYSCVCMCVCVKVFELLNLNQCR